MNKKKLIREFDNFLQETIDNRNRTIVYDDEDRNNDSFNGHFIISIEKDGLSLIHLAGFKEIMSEDTKKGIKGSSNSSFTDRNYLLKLLKIGIQAVNERIKK